MLFVDSAAELATLWNLCSFMAGLIGKLLFMMFESWVTSIMLPIIEFGFPFLVFYAALSFMRIGGSLIEFLYEQLSSEMITCESPTSQELCLDVLRVAQVAYYNFDSSAGLTIVSYFRVSTEEDFAALLFFA